MHRTKKSTVRSVVSELQTSLRNALAWYGTLVRLVRSFKQRIIQTLNERTKRTVPVPLPKACTILHRKK